MIYPAILLWQPLLPLPIIAGVILLAVIFSIRSAPAPRRNPRQLAALTIRVLAIGLIGLLLLGPTHAEPDTAAASESDIHLLVDLSASMTSRDESGQSRWDAFRSVWLVDAEAVPGGVSWWAFGESLRPTTRAALLELTPTDRQTRLADALTRTLDRLPDQAGSILLFSDGRPTEGLDASLLDSLAFQAGERGIPIDVVALTQTDPARPGISVQLTATPLRIFNQDSVTLAATIHAPPGTPLVARIFGNDQPLDQRRFTAAASGVTTSRFTLTPPAIPDGTTAEYHYRISVQPADRDEATAREAHAFITQLGSPIRILLLEAAPHPDTRALIRHLNAQPRVQLTAIQSLGPERPIILSGTDSLPDLSRAATWSDYDLVLLGQRLDRLLTPEAWTGLATALDRGTALWLTRGQPTTGELPEVIAAHLPARFLPLDQPDRVQLSASNQAPWQLDETPIALNEMPAVYRTHRWGSISPAAQPWMTLTRSDQTEEPALLAARTGTTRIVMQSVGGLARWTRLPPRLADLDGRYALIINGIVGWLGLGETFAPGSPFALSIETTDAELGQPLSITAHARIPRPDADWPTLRLTAPDGSTQTLTLTTDPGETTRRATAITPDQAGIYTLTLDADPSLTRRFAAADRSLEMLDPSPRPDLLASLAERSGGAVIPHDDPQRWRELIDQRATSRAAPPTVESLDSARTRPAWPQLWLFGLIVGLLAIEWFVRRSGGLP